MHRRRYAQVAAIAILVGTVAGCGGGGGNGVGDKMVWCAAPGETVDAEFKREYPELYMSQRECDRWKEVQR